jgi:hypothetical protein
LEDDGHFLSRWFKNFLQTKTQAPENFSGLRFYLAFTKFAFTFYFSGSTARIAFLQSLMALSQVAVVNGQRRVKINYVSDRPQHQT